jgi:glucose/arabinose dehydrogenase
MKRLIFALLLVLGALPAAAQDTPPNPDAVELVEVVSGFRRPLYVTNAGDGSGRLFVLEQGGRIYIVQNDQRLETPFLDLTEMVSPDANGSGYSERGLLGLAFHPDYETNGLFFVHYTDVNGDTVVARYSVSDDPNIADPNSAVTLLTAEQPYPNHNGGQLAFGPDGYLYIGLGDGGSGGDPQNNAQTLSNLLGKVLRIDVGDGAESEGYTIPADNPFVSGDAAPEIWAYGLRNPWRFSFDSESGDLYVADVGQNNWEEVNFLPSGSPGGANFGWRIYEASHPYSGEAAPPDLIMPIAEYSHSEGISVTGGYVYRGEQIADLQGIYLYGDFGYGTIWYTYQDAAGVWQNGVYKRNTGLTISSFGVDEAGELYLVNYGGALLRFQPAA